jgi:hypothetical protein
MAACSTRVSIAHIYYTWPEVGAKALASEIKMVIDVEWISNRFLIIIGSNQSQGLALISGLIGDGQNVSTKQLSRRSA